MPQSINVNRIVSLSAARFRRATAAGRTLILTQDHLFLGLKAGDVLVWVHNAKPLAGDLILVEPPNAEIRPAIFLSYLNTGRIIEWADSSEETVVAGKIAGVVTHIVIPELVIVALDLGLEAPDTAGPSFKLLIDTARLFGALVQSGPFRSYVKAAP